MLGFFSRKNKAIKEGKTGKEKEGEHIFGARLEAGEWGEHKEIPNVPFVMALLKMESVDLESLDPRHTVGSLLGCAGWQENQAGVFTQP